MVVPKRVLDDPQKFEAFFALLQEPGSGTLMKSDYIRDTNHYLHISKETSGVKGELKKHSSDPPLSDL